MFVREGFVKVGAVVAAALVSVACGGAVEEEAFDETDDGLSTSSDAYVVLRRDQRKCAAPKCGGYFAADVNKSTAVQYVSGLDFSQSTLDATAQGIAAGTLNEVVVRGRLGRLDSRSGTRPLIVKEAYRSLPGVTRSSSDVFYKVALRNPQITCVTAPCHNLRAEKLATSSKPYFTAVDVELASLQFVQQEWLVHEIEERGAIVTGQILDGQRFPGGPEKVLVATQVFLKLGNGPESCPVFRLAACKEGQTWTYARDERRCVLPVSCQPTMYCRAMVPACQDGYVLQSWIGGSGCPAYACDPAFTVPGQE